MINLNFSNIFEKRAASLLDKKLAIIAEEFERLALVETVFHLVAPFHPQFFNPRSYLQQLL